MLSPNNCLLLLPPIVTKCHRMNFGVLCQMEQEMAMLSYELCSGSQKQHTKNIAQVIARQLLPLGILVNLQSDQNSAILPSLIKSHPPQAPVVRRHLWHLEPQYSSQSCLSLPCSVGSVSFSVCRESLPSIWFYSLTCEYAVSSSD